MTYSHRMRICSPFRIVVLFKEIFLKPPVFYSPNEARFCFSVILASSNNSSCVSLRTCCIGRLALIAFWCLALTSLSCIRILNSVFFITVVERRDLRTFASDKVKWIYYWSKEFLYIGLSFLLHSFFFIIYFFLSISIFIHLYLELVAGKENKYNQQLTHTQNLKKIKKTKT